MHRPTLNSSTTPHTPTPHTLSHTGTAHIHTMHTDTTYTKTHRHPGQGVCIHTQLCTLTHPPEHTHTYLCVHTALHTFKCSLHNSTWVHTLLPTFQLLSAMPTAAYISLHRSAQGHNQHSTHGIMCAHMLIYMYTQLYAYTAHTHI